jgi:hypothetical protein
MTEEVMESNESSTPETSEYSPSQDFNSKIEINGDTIDRNHEPDNSEFNEFLNKLPDNVKELLTKNGVKDFNSFAKDYEGFNVLKGKKGIVEPSEDASDEDKAAFRNNLLDKLGRPDNGEYDFDLPDGTNEDYVDQQFIDDFAKIAYENGMSKDGFQNMVDHIYSAYNKTIQSFTDDFNTYKRDVEKKLGEDTLDDTTTSSNVSLKNIREHAQDKLSEAMAARDNRDFKLADRLQKEANEIYAKSFN